MGLLENLRDRFITIPVAKQITSELQKSELPNQMEAFAVPLNFNNQYSNKAKPLAGITYDALRNMSRYHEISRACINIRKRQITQLMWDIVADDETDIKSHAAEVADIKLWLENCAGFNKRFTTLLDIMIEDYLVIDAVTLYRRRTNNGALISLVPVDPTTIRLRVDESGLIPMPPEVAYEQWIRGEKKAELTTDELIYDMQNPRSDSPYGFSVMEALTMIIEGSLRTGMFNNGYFTDGTMPEGFYQLPAEWSLDQIKAFQEHFDAMLSGDSRTMRKIKFMPAGGTGFQAAKEFNFVGMEPWMMWLMKVTTSLFGITPTELGFTEHTNRAISVEQTEISKRNTIKPLALHIESLINDVLKSPLAISENGKVTRFLSPVSGLKFKFMDLDTKDEALDSEIADRNVRNGFISIDDWRKDHGLDPLGAPPFVVVGNQIVTVADIASGNIPSNMPIAPASAQDQPPKPSPQEDLKRWEKKALNDIKEGRPFRQFTSEVLDHYTVSHIEEELKKCTTKEAVKKCFAAWGDPESKEEGTELTKSITPKNTWISRYVQSRPVNHFKMKVYKALSESFATITDASIRKAVEDASKLSQDEISRIRQVIAQDYGSFDNFYSATGLKDSLENFYNDGGNQMLDKFDVTASFELKNPEVIAKLQDRANFLIKSVDDTTLDDIATKIADGMENGLDWQKIAENIRADNQQIAEYRSELIARMESANAANMAQADFADRNGFATKSWELSPTHDVDDDCDSNADAGTIGIDDNFPEGDDAPLHVNCMCEVNYYPPDDWSLDWTGQ